MSVCPALLMSCLGRRGGAAGEVVGRTTTTRPHRLQLLHQGDAHVCLLHNNHNHGSSSLVAKILSSSKVLKRWELHTITLTDDALVSQAAAGVLRSALSLRDVEDVQAVDCVGQRGQPCVRLVLAHGSSSLLLQLPNSYTRDQWLHSLLWKKNLCKYRDALSRQATKPEAVLRDVKALVELSVSCPLQDESITREPLELCASLLPEDPASLVEALSPLLELAVPPPALCLRLGALCGDGHPPPPPVVALVVRRALTRSVDAPPLRLLSQRFLLALGAAPGGFVAGLHGAASSCPHPRALNNLGAVALALAPHACCLAVLDAASEYDDWLPGLAQLLRPVPFPEDVVADKDFFRGLTAVLRRIGLDPRCEVHSGVLAVREGKQGWFQLLSQEHAHLWGLVLETLLGCCCQRKHFLSSLTAQLDTCTLLALRECDAALKALCLMLEWGLLQAEDQRQQALATLQATPRGRRRHQDLCVRLRHLDNLQEKGGPRSLTLPSRSSDADVAALLRCGSFGSLERLSLAFTHVTSACAQHLIKLPSLRHLNLWATQFGDAGLLMICEHLQRLQVLNLCETQVSDKGISALASLTGLRKLNLNSTRLSAQTLERLRRQLPALQECDVRYTEAW